MLNRKLKEAAAVSIDLIPITDQLCRTRILQAAYRFIHDIPLSESVAYTYCKLGVYKQPSLVLTDTEE
jgi:hypothetical protein